MTRRRARPGHGEPDVGEVLAAAAARLCPVRVHLRDGEVLVARVLHVDDDELVYAVVRSSRPERYGVCDSTGFRVARGDVERARLLPER